MAGMKELMARLSGISARLKEVGETANKLSEVDEAEELARELGEQSLMGKVAPEPPLEKTREEAIKQMNDPKYQEVVDKAHRLSRVVGDWISGD